jgi:hypothetical protein
VVSLKALTVAVAKRSVPRSNFTDIANSNAMRTARSPLSDGADRNAEAGVTLDLSDRNSCAEILDLGAPWRLAKGKKEATK